MRTQEFDPINLEIMWQRLISIVEECWITIWRTSFSVVVGEALDFGCEILDPKGRVLAHPWRSMPAFNFSLPNTLRGMLEKYPIDTLRPGDVLITNDPWLGAGHLFDITLLTPVFNKQGRVVAVMGGVAHVADIGGTRARASTREVFDEGLFLPPLKLYDEGRLNEDIVAIIENNVRLAPMVLGDIHALVAANKVGAERIISFMTEYGIEDLEDLTTEVQNRTEQATRQAIRSIKDGIYETKQSCNGPDGPFQFGLRIVIDDDSIHVQLFDVPPQFGIGGSNTTYSVLLSEVVYLLKCVLTPNVPGNDGDFRPITVSAPEGSVFNCRRPASVNNRTRTLWTIAPAVMNAMAQAAPERVPAAYGFCEPIRTYGHTSRGAPFNDHMFQGGGQGASASADGQTTMLFPTSAGNVSVEIFESRTGFLIGEKEYISDSGGAGTYRGAPGQRVSLRVNPNEEGGFYQVGAWPIGLGFGNDGLFGGHAGSQMRLLTRASREDLLTPVDSDGIFTELQVGMEIVLELPGGSGYGDPAKRDLSAIKSDLAEGIVTEKGVLNHYGRRVGGK